MELYLCSAYGPSWFVVGWTLLAPFIGAKTGWKKTDLWLIKEAKIVHVIKQIWNKRIDQNPLSALTSLGQFQGKNQY